MNFTNCMIIKGTNFPIFRKHLVGHSLHIFLFSLRRTPYLDKAGLEVTMSPRTKSNSQPSCLSPLPSKCWDYMECTKSPLLWTVNKASGPELQHARTSGFPQGSFYFLHVVVSLVNMSEPSYGLI